MLIGDPTAWLKRFQDVECRMAERLPALWPACIQGLPGNPRENEISRRLVVRLKRDHVVRHIGAIHSQMELLAEQRSGDVSIKGYLDIAIVLNQDADSYVAFECKRLNVNTGHGRKSQASSYVKGGMARYLSAQYAQSLPLGIMVGYVLDSDLEAAARSIDAAISGNRKALSLTGPLARLRAFGFVQRYMSSHGRKGKESDFEIRHILLPMSPAGLNS
ncbi:MAG: hypothetical protein H7841_10900 [Magnetospirillum sp. WYHS-4]